MSQAFCNRIACACDSAPKFEKPGDHIIPGSKCLCCGHDSTYHDFQLTPNCYNPSPFLPVSHKYEAIESNVSPPRVHTPGDWFTPTNTQLSPQLCRARTKTIERMAAHWIKHKILHVRGTPSSGKTTLGRLTGTCVGVRNPSALVINITDFHYEPRRA